MKKEIAVFISPHGFGHAARTIAVLEELHKYIPELHARLVTTVPEMLFKNLPMPWSYHRETVDIGLVQKNAFLPDILQTSEALKKFLPFKSELTETCCEICSASEMILCDISPLGIDIGNRLQVPSVLIENFTWDWIYKKLPEKILLHPFINYLEEKFNSATHRIQSEPLCSSLQCNKTCSPIARSPKTAASIIEKQIGSKNRKIILITMGGIPQDLPFIERLSQYRDYFFVLAGQKQYRSLFTNVLLLPFDTPFFHPDLINSSSLVVCKSGYSTIAECAQTNTSICCINRPVFAESAIIERYVQEKLGGTVIDYQQFHDGSWLNLLPQLLGTRKKMNICNGAKDAAQFICSLFSTNIL